MYGTALLSVWSNQLVTYICTYVQCVVDMYQATSATENEHKRFAACSSLSCAHEGLYGGYFSMYYSMITANFPYSYLVSS